MPAPGKGRNQSRLAGTRRADKGDATVRNVNGRRMERRNSALMAQHSERGTEQIGTDFAIVRGRRRVYQDFFAGPHQKAASRRKVEQYFSSVVSSDVLPIAERCSSRSELLRDRGAADHDLIVRCSLVTADLKPKKRKIRNNAQTAESVNCRFHNLSLQI